MGKQARRTAPDRAPLLPLGVHIPPEEAAALASLAFEVVAVAWQRKRLSLSMRLVHARRNIEFALEHDGGVRALLRQSLPRRR